MSESDVLQKLALADIPKLLEVLEKFLPDSTIAYNSVKTMLDWSVRCPNLEFSVLCPKGNWQNGTMVQLMDKLAVPEKLFGTVYAQEEHLEELKECLLNTKLIDWHRMIQLTAVPKRCIPCLQDILAINGYTDLNNFAEDCYLNYKPIEEAKMLSVPELPKNMRIGPLNVNHLVDICDNWEYYLPRVRPVIQKMIELNQSVGVFITNDEGKEELAATLLQTEYGGIGLMQTFPKFRRRGYGSIALAYLTRQLGVHGVTPFGLQVVENKTSSILFGDKLKYKRGNSLYAWIKPQKI